MYFLGEVRSCLIAHRVADEVWIATALLPREYPDSADFAVADIVARAQGENLAGTPSLRPGVRAHVVQHCVATKPSSPNRYRMLVETGRGRRRLYLPTDRCHPGRRNGKSVPRRQQILEAYRPLLDWYDELCDSAGLSRAQDPILALRGLGKELWRGEEADTYAPQLGEGWQ